MLSIATIKELAKTDALEGVWCLPADVQRHPHGGRLEAYLRVHQRTSGGFMDEMVEAAYSSLEGEAREGVG